MEPGAPRFRRWSKKEELEMLQALRKGTSLVDVAQTMDRSVRAILIRLGGILARPDDHPEYIPRDHTGGLSAQLLQKANDMYHEQQQQQPQQPQPSTRARPQPKDNVDTDQIMRAIQEVHKEIRKIRLYLKSTTSPAPHPSA